LAISATDQAKPFAGRHVFVTGGGTGIGAAIAYAFAREGAALTLVGRREAPVRDKAAALSAAGARAAALACDVTDEEAVARCFREAVALLGPVDILVNNAGMVESAPLAKVSRATLERILAVNLMQLFFCTQQVLPEMKRRGFGRIVNIASTAALTGYPYVSAYCAAKHGALGFTRAIAMETVGTGVTVNAVCPGYTDTPLLDGAIETVQRKTGRAAEDVRAELLKVNPSGRAVKPEEVANAVLWLAGPGSDSITGQAIVVAGGEIMSR
jgi:NAD(P)-dependent dehydrogenase (short-subunit alcohol dehydrogenase family)